MSRAKCKGLLTVLVFLCGCQAEAELLHPGGQQQKPGATRIEVGSRDPSEDADTAPPSPAVVVRDASESAMTGEPDAGPRMPIQTELPKVHLVLKNATGRKLWYSAGCMSYGPGFVRPAHDMPRSEAESQAQTEAFRELGCVCECSTLGPNEICRREKCSRNSVTCGIATTYPVAPGETVEADYTPFTIQIDFARRCSAPVAYRAQTEMLAAFCYTRDLGLPIRCTEVPYRMGDPSVTYVVEDAPDDAGT